MRINSLPAFIGAGIVLAILIVSVVFNVSFGPEKAKASTDFVAYEFKTASTTDASATVPYRITTGQCVFGSLIVASSSVSRIGIYDGTTATTSASGARKIADFAGATAAGTYTFDVRTENGIVLDLPSTYSGYVTITYRDCVR